MTYATQADIQFAAGGAERLLSLADWDRDGIVDAEVIATAQAWVDEWVSSHLRMRYATAPNIAVARIAAQEAVYQMQLARGMALEPNGLELQKARQHQLEEIRDGELRPSEPLPSKSSAVKAEVIENCSPVSRNGLKGFW